MCSSDESPKQPTKQRPNQGRRKVTIERIANENHRRVTFSKRRAGLFKKTGELCTLTGAKAAVVVFSPSEKAYSFGHPDVTTIAHRFNPQNPSPIRCAPNNPPVQVPGSATLELNHVQGFLEIEKKRAEEIKQAKRDSGIQQVNGEYHQLEEKKWAILAFGHNMNTYARNSTVNAMYHPMVAYGGFSAEINPNFGFPSQPMAPTPNLGPNTIIPFGQGTSEDPYRVGEGSLSCGFNTGFGPSGTGGFY